MFGRQYAAALLLANASTSAIPTADRHDFVLLLLLLPLLPGV
jgi:hypothetical protein